PEQSYRGIPRGIFAIDHPAPLGGWVKGEPRGASERPGQMGNARITGDDQVEMFHDRGRIQEVAVPALAPQVRDREGTGPELFRSAPLLKADQSDAWYFSQRRQGIQGKRPPRVVGGIRRTAPRDADPETGDRTDLVAPSLDHPRVQ